MKQEIPESNKPTAQQQSPDPRKMRIGVIRSRILDYERASTHSNRILSAREIVKWATVLLHWEESNPTPENITNGTVSTDTSWPGK